MLDNCVDKSQTGILIIHSINPYGHKYFRRVTENNVDLNRNFDIDENLFNPTGDYYNDIYPKIKDFLNPKTKYSYSLFKNISFFFKTVSLIFKHSKKDFKQAVLQGQYEFEDGIFFGGKHFEQQNKELEILIARILENYKKIFAIDLHTGYGKKNKLHFFKAFEIKDEKTKDKMDTIFSGYKLVGGKKKDQFYTVKGSFGEYIFKLCSSQQLCIPIAFEYGTNNSHKTMGQIKSLRIMIGENQCFHYGAMNSKDEKKINNCYKEMFFPTNTKWRNKVIGQTRDVFPTLIDRFEKISE